MDASVNSLEKRAKVSVDCAMIIEDQSGYGYYSCNRVLFESITSRSYRIRAQCDDECQQV